MLITTNLWMAPLFVFLAGILTSFAPCSLSNVPLIIAYVGGTKERETKKSLYLSLIFSLGSSITFTVLGVIASLLGKIISLGSTSWLYIVMGILMVMMALQVLEVFTFIPSTYAQTKNKKKGYIGAFITGILGGFFSSPCATPVLIVILALVAEKGSIIGGIGLLLLYSIGHSFLVIISGTFMGLTKSITYNKKYGILSQFFKIITGIAIMIIGFYFVYTGL